jgi:hypothetical protein
MARKIFNPSQYSGGFSGDYRTNYSYPFEEKEVKEEVPLQKQRSRDPQHSMSGKNQEAMARTIAQQRGSGDDEGSIRYIQRRMEHEQSRNINQTVASGNSKKLHDYYKNISRTFNTESIKGLYGLYQEGESMSQPILPNRMEQGQNIQHGIVGNLGVLNEKINMGDRTKLVFQDRSIVVRSDDVGWTVLMDSAPVAASSAQGPALFKEQVDGPKRKKQAIFQDNSMKKVQGAPTDVALMGKTQKAATNNYSGTVGMGLKHGMPEHDVHAQTGKFVQGLGYGKGTKFLAISGHHKTVPDRLDSSFGHIRGMIGEGYKNPEQKYHQKTSNKPLSHVLNKYRDAEVHHSEYTGKDGKKSPVTYLVRKPGDASPKKSHEQQISKAAPEIDLDSHYSSRQDFHQKEFEKAFTASQKASTSLERTKQRKVGSDDVSGLVSDAKDSEATKQKERVGKGEMKVFKADSPLEHHGNMLKGFEAYKSADKSTLDKVYGRTTMSASEGTSGKIYATNVEQREGKTLEAGKKPMGFPETFSKGELGKFSQGMKKSGNLPSDRIKRMEETATQSVGKHARGTDETHQIAFDLRDPKTQKELITKKASFNMTVRHKGETHDRLYSGSIDDHQALIGLALHNKADIKTSFVSMPPQRDTRKESGYTDIMAKSTKKMGKPQSGDLAFKQRNYSNVQPQEPMERQKASTKARGAHTYGTSSAGQGYKLSNVGAATKSPSSLVQMPSAMYGAYGSHKGQMNKPFRQYEKEHSITRASEEIKDKKTIGPTAVDVEKENIGKQKKEGKNVKILQDGIGKGFSVDDPGLFS